MALNKRKKSTEKNDKKKTTKSAIKKTTNQSKTTKKTGSSGIKVSGELSSLIGQSKVTKTSLRSKKKAELVEIALEIGLKRISSLKKDDIIEKILEQLEKQKENKNKKTDKKEEREPKKVTITNEEDYAYSTSKKYEVEKDDYILEPEYPEETKDLPQEYDTTKVVLLIKDPWWAYVYWELDNETREKMGIVKGQHNKRLKLRVYDVTDGGRNEYFDVYVHDYTNSWYVNLPRPNRKYVAELLVEEAEFTEPVAESNPTFVPRSSISEDQDIEWMTPDWAKIYVASAGFRDKVYMNDEGKFEVIDDDKLAQQLISTNLSSLSLVDIPGSDRLLTLGSSENLLSSLPSSESAIKKVPSPEKEKDFWLKADCELIVYGATESDAEVKVKGKVINLRPDGTFTLRFALPNGNHMIDINAVNNDRDMEKWINFYVSRETEKDA